jgi:hypothetical protein
MASGHANCYGKDYGAEPNLGCTCCKAQHECAKATIAGLRARIESAVEIIADMIPGIGHEDCKKPAARKTIEQRTKVKP